MSKSRQQRFRRANASQPSPASVSLAHLIETPNVWSSWFEYAQIAPLGWPTLAALMVRELSVSDALAALAPVIASLGQKANALLADGEPEEGDLPLDFDDWLWAWHEVCHNTLGEAIGQLAGSRDIAWFARHGSGPDADPQALLWFLLRGIGAAPLDQLDRQQSAPGEAELWLLRLASNVDANTDLMAVTLASLYNQFRAAYLGATAPLPLLPMDEITKRIVREVSDDDASSRPATEWSILLCAREEWTSVLDLLGPAPRHWPLNASLIRKLRANGLIEMNAPKLTAKGQKHLKRWN